MLPASLGCLIGRSSSNFLMLTVAPLVSARPRGTPARSVRDRAIGTRPRDWRAIGARSVRDRCAIGPPKSSKTGTKKKEKERKKKKEKKREEGTSSLGAAVRTSWWDGSLLILRRAMTSRARYGIYQFQCSVSHVVRDCRFGRTASSPSTSFLDRPSESTAVPPS